MNIFRNIDAIPEFRNAVVTIGSFDGVHRGHQRILKRVKRLAQAYRGESVVVTFDRHPRQVLSPWDETLKLLTTTDEKLKYLEEYGIDHVVLITFTVEFSQIGPREYVERFLINKLQTRCLVVGYDHRFGRDRQGNYPLLQSYADQGRFDLVQIPQQEVDRITVSSTKIRAALLQGEMRKSTNLLNHPYRISGHVVKGREIGRALGYPTANIETDDPAKLVPAPGVYAAFVHLEGTTYPAMLYIGTRPTFDTGDRAVSIEVHLLDFSQEIYGSFIEVDVIDFIRKDLTLEGPEALRQQITKDEQHIRVCLANDVRTREIPSVGLVILNYNGRQILEHYLPAFGEIRHGKLDLLLADNASTDDSVAYVEEEFPDIQIIRLERNYGFAEGYNRALANLDYDYFAIVNSDVMPTPDWLSRIVSVMETDRRIAACQPKVRSDRQRELFEYAGACGGYLDMLGYPFCAGRILQTQEEDLGQYDGQSQIFWASGAALVIRAELFHAAGGFDGTYFAHQEEIDLCWTLQRMGYTIRVVPDSVVYHLGGGTLEYDSPGKVYLNFRNNLVTILKQMSVLGCIGVLPLRVLLDFSAALHFLFRGRPANTWAVIRAYGSFVARIPRVMKKRLKLGRLIEARRIGPSQAKCYRGSILLDYYLFGKRTFTELSAQVDAKTRHSQDPAR